ncbi:hypothetical protein FXO38_35398 [Capsicum annuum]|nr:hypothetical protein FXO37_35950 [Capsicum annuum]KAF3614938.1 hypothetical protein FXO38_35398 [Capsicum annuum]
MERTKKVKQWFKLIKEGIMQLEESTTKLLEIGKSESSDISVVQMGLDGLKQVGVNIFSQVLSCMHSLKSQVSSLNDDLDSCVQTSYSSFVKNVEKSYGKPKEGGRQRGSTHQSGETSRLSTHKGLLNIQET